MGLFSLGRGIAKVGGIQLTNQCAVLDTATAPTDGTSGTYAGVANAGTLLLQSNGTMYVNTGTKASPTWTVSGGGGGQTREVYNATGGNLTAGSLVALSGWDETTKLPKVVKADNDAASGRMADFVLPAAIANAASGLASETFRLTAQNTGGTAVGDPVYLGSTAGGFTFTPVTAADAIAQIVGRVAVVNGATGVVEFDISAAATKIGTSELEDLAVTTGKLAANAVTAAKVDGTAGVAAVNKVAILGATKNLDELGLPVSGLKIGASGAEVAVTGTAASLNLLDGSSAGVAVASKLACLGASKNLDELGLPVSGLKIGASGAEVAMDRTAAQINVLVGGVAAGYKLARGVSSVTGTGDVVTGLTTVVAVVAVAQSDLDGDTLAGVSATIGNQAGAPAAGSITLKAWKVTTGGAAGNPTLIAANAAKDINWVAIGV